MEGNVIKSAIFAQALALSGCYATESRHIVDRTSGRVSQTVAAVSPVRTGSSAVPPITVPTSVEVAVPNIPQTLKKDLAGISKTPLGMSGLSKRVSDFLGLNQYEAVLALENKVVPTIDSKGKIVYETSLEKYSEIQFPAVFYGLEMVFPATVADFSKSGRKLPTGVKETDDLVFVDVTPEGKTALAFYQNGKLALATHVSLGTKGHATPRGTFTTSYKESYKRSKLYENAPMPYAVNVEGHIFLHHGRVNGKPLSHGCIRVPGFYQEVIFREIKSGTKVVIR
jgi:lipoprotein-anchoring transpeptidase ErfK/SrfK